MKQLFSTRFIKGQNYAIPIIYEWEDVISKELKIPVKKYPFIYRIINRFGIHMPYIGPNKDTFRFVINGSNYDEPMNNKHIIPCIIDFFEPKDKLQDFYNKHSHNKLLLVSSPFDYQYLKDNKYPGRVELFAYSLSDKYAIPKKPIEKKYDIVLTGRQDPVLYSFFKEYVKKHPNVSYVKRGASLENDREKTKDYYVNGKECIGTIATREEFINLQSQGRVTLYGTQGYMEGFTKGFYHMTPHFLEIIASCSHVIARYPLGKDGVDPQFYEFDKFSPSIETYEQFEIAMNKAITTDVDVKMYSEYLSKHYTSVRVKQLKELLKSL